MDGMIERRMPASWAGWAGWMSRRVCTKIENKEEFIDVILPCLDTSQTLLQALLINFCIEQWLTHF